jgi:TP901 family phage tail tape measure protein
MPGEALQIRIVASGASQVQAESAKSSAALSGIGKAAKGASAESAAASSAMSARLKKAGTVASAVGKQTAKGLKYGTVAVVGLGVAAAKMSIDFDHSMGQISEQAGASRKEVEKLKGEVLDLAKKSIFGPNELAQGLFHIESVGIRGAKAMKTLNAAQKLATVGNADLETTTYAMVSAQETGIKGTKNLSKEIGLLNAIVGTGDLRMEDLTASLSSGILPTAKVFGLTLRDVGAALDTMTARGVPAQQAATRLRMTFSLLGAQTDKAKGALSSIGIQEGQLGETLQKKGLIPAVQLLADKLKNAGDKAAQAQVLTEAFGGGKSSSTIMTLVQNVDDLSNRYDALGKNAGNFNEKLKEAKNEPINRLKTAWSSLQVLLINLGSKIVPSVVDGFTKVVDIVTDKKLTTDEKFSKLGTSLPTRSGRSSRRPGTSARRWSGSS